MNIRKSWLFKSSYKANLKGYLFIRGTVLILDGVLSFFAAFLNYNCDLYVRFCEWNILNDIKCRRKKR